MIQSPQSINSAARELEGLLHDGVGQYSCPLEDGGSDRPRLMLCGDPRCYYKSRAAAAQCRVKATLYEASNRPSNPFGCKPRFYALVGNICSWARMRAPTAA